MLLVTVCPEAFFTKPDMSISSALLVRYVREHLTSDVLIRHEFAEHIWCAQHTLHSRLDAVVADFLRTSVGPTIGLHGNLLDSSRWSLVSRGALAPFRALDVDRLNQDKL